MPDDTENFGPLLSTLAGGAGALGANAITQQAYQAIIKNLQDRFGDYSKLPPAGYQNIAPQKLGPSALSGIQNDAQSRPDEQAAIAQLDDVARHGGLTLADRAALNEAEQTLGRSNAARNASVTNQFAARGQLGSGAQLAAELANNQNAAMSANQRGESIAAQAQQRAMDAVAKKAGFSREMANDDYARKKAAAEATDSINKYNASMATDASKYNNTLAGQNFRDQLSRLSGENRVTGQLNTALLGSGQQNAATAAGLGYGGASLLGQVGNLASKAGKSGGGGSGDPNDPGLDQSGQNDLSGSRGGAGDLSGGNTDVEDPGVDPSELSNPYGGY